MMFGNKVMAEVVTENSRQVIHLGSEKGDLRIAVIKPLTKQANQSVKKNLEEKAKTTIICVGFYHDSHLLHRAESKMITAASNPSTSSDATGKKKRKIKPNAMTRIILSHQRTRRPRIPNFQQFEIVPGAVVMCFLKKKRFLQSSGETWPACLLLSPRSMLPSKWVLV